MGRSTFNVFEGVNRDVVAWYGVVFQFNSNQVLIAKPAPKGLAQSQSQAYWQMATEIAIPSLSELEPNSNDDAIKQNLGRLIGISPNQTIVNEGRSTAPFQATIDHTKYYLFQDQNLVANKKLLFWRQSEDYVSQHIKDTVPYFLGAVQEDRLQVVQRLRDCRRDLKRLQQEVREAELLVSAQNEAATKLYTEALILGMIADAPLNVTDDFVYQQLQFIADWGPNQTIGVSNTSIDVEQENYKTARRKHRLKSQEIIEAENYLKQADGFRNEAQEQAVRLEAFKLFDNKIDHDNCPLCNSKLEVPTPKVIALNNALDLLTSNVSNTQQERPRIEGYINKLQDELATLRQDVMSADQRLKALISQQEAAVRLQDINVQSARISGRVSLYLENLKRADPNSKVQEQIVNLTRLIADLVEQLEVDQVEDILTSILNVVGIQMTNIAAELNLEHAIDSRYRFETKKLTVIADSPDRPVPMERMGSGENWLGCHLALFLSLHTYFVQKNRPVPNFIVFDQPSQVYFPSEFAYKSLDGSDQNLQRVGADVLAVQRMFNLLFNLTEKLNPDFQVIVIEHANLEDERFQNALAEDPWTNGKALIPHQWLQ